MNYFSDLRRQYILWRLATVGEVRRADIARTFGIEMSSASGDFTRLLADQPTIATYDKSGKRYISRRHQPPARLAAIAQALGWE